MRNIPISVAENIAKLYGKNQIAILSVDSKTNTISSTTFGKSEADKYVMRSSLHSLLEIIRMFNEQQDEVFIPSICLEEHHDEELNKDPFNECKECENITCHHHKDYFNYKTIILNYSDNGVELIQTFRNKELPSNATKHSKNRR